MSKKVIIALVIALAVGTMLWLNKPAVRTPAVHQQIKEINTGAAKAAPKTMADEVKVSLVGITSIVNQKKALLRVRWPAGTSIPEQTYMLSEGESKDGITIDSIDVTNGAVTLRVQQDAKTINVGKGS